MYLGWIVRPVPAPAARAHLDVLPLFACLNPAERGIVLPHCRVLVFRKGETVFEEGERSSNLSFVVLGGIKVVKRSQERSVVVRMLGPGEPIGIVAALQSIPYPATAVAVEPTTVLQLPERDFFGLADRHPEITRQLLQMFMVRQAELAQRLQDMTLSVERRVARGLLVLARKIGRAEGSGILIPLSLNRQDVADLAGTTIETAIRVMSRWGKEGLVVTLDHGFSIPDLARLRPIAEGPDPDDEG